MTDANLARLIDDGVTTVRLSYPDLHGIARGKEYPVGVLRPPGRRRRCALRGHHDGRPAPQRASQASSMGSRTSSRGRTPRRSHGSRGIPRWRGASPISSGWAAPPYGCRLACGAEARGRRVREARPTSPCSGRSSSSICASPTRSAEWGWRRYVDNPSHVYTVGVVADPRGVLREMLARLRRPGPRRLRGEPRVRPLRSTRSTSATPTRSPPATGRSSSRRRSRRWPPAHGLLATFIGKPWNDDEGSGFHLHMSIGCDERGGNLLNDPDGEEGLSDLAHHFLAGILEHGPALMPFFNPTTNAYRRIHEEALVPTLVSWGHDNRLTLARVPRERGEAPPGSSCGSATARRTPTWRPPPPSSRGSTGSTASSSRPRRWPA